LYGWRSTFYAVVAIGVATVIAIALLVPAAGEEQKGGGILSEIKVLGKLQVWLAMLISALASGSLSAVLPHTHPTPT
ncbi:MFS transporter, partial [Mycobacterium tuberculosis]|nr:MFS transporter [Mycobacterium tuberculosis]